MARSPRFAGRWARVALAALTVLGVVGLGAAHGCKTRRFESAGLSSSGDAAYVHWVPGQRGHNGSWDAERQARQARLAKLIDPRLDERTFQGLVDGDYKKAIWGFEWQRDTPVGYSGIPLIVFRAIRHDAETRTDSLFKNIWRDMTWYGLTPHPNDFDDAGRLRTTARDRRVLPLGMGWTRSPGTEAEKKGEVGQFLGSLNLDPDIQSQVVQRAFISCGACHTGRVARPDGSIVFMYGAPSTEYDQTAFGKAVADTLEVVKAEVEAGRGGDLARRLNVSIDALNQSEDQFPYGNSTQEILLQSSWKSPFHYVLRKTAVKKIKDKMPEILQAMPKQLALRNQIVGKLAASAYHSEGGAAAQGRTPPPFDGESPGQLDAFGFGGAIVEVVKEQIEGGQEKFPTSTFRPWDYLSWVTFGDSSPVWQDIAKQKKAFSDKVTAYVENLKTDNSGEPIVPRFAAKVDPSAIWGERPALRSQANWDGNQKSAGARALSTSLAIVASPANVDVQGSEYVASFMAYDPMAHGKPKGESTPPRYPSASPVYPFEVDDSLLAAGQKIFEQKCYTCHYPQNRRVYPINPRLVPSDRLTQATNTEPPPEGWVGTDPYRAIQITTPVRNGLLALWNLTCQMRKWCASNDASGEDKDVFRPRGATRGDNGPELTGYVAAPLDGIWARAPYLHNGSVPNVRALLVPRLRQTSVRCGDGPTVPGFWRGNIMYNERDLGFVHDRPPFEKCNGSWTPGGAVKSPFDEISGQRPLYPTASKSARIFNTTLEGSSNGGHTGAYLGIEAQGEGSTDSAWETWTVGQVLGQDASATSVRDRLAADALIEYMKTL